MEAPTGLANPDHPPFTSIFIGLPAGQVGELLLERPGVVLRLHLATSGIEAFSVVLPLDVLFEVRVQAALRLWRALMGRRPGPDPATLSPDRVSRLILALRTLDGLDDGVFRSARSLVSCSVGRFPRRIGSRTICISA